MTPPSLILQSSSNGYDGRLEGPLLLLPLLAFGLELASGLDEGLGLLTLGGLVLDMPEGQPHKKVTFQLLDGFLCIIMTWVDFRPFF